MTTRYSEPQQSAIRVQRWLFFFYLVFVIYGSLVPLDFVAHPWDTSVQTLVGLRDLPLDFSSRSDWATNLVLFIPLTFLAGQGFGGGARGVARVLIGLFIAVLASALAVGIEFTQMFFPPRTPSQNDIVALSISGAIGVCVQWAVGRTVDHWVAGYWQVQMQGEKVSRLLKGYLFVLLAFNVMPLDLTISPVEIFHKWNEGRLILVPFAGLHGSVLEKAYQAITDVLIWVPAGALWALQPGHSLWKVVRKGLLAGLTVEVLQLFVLSRTTDITSVGLAGLGAGLGAAAVLHLGQKNPARLSRVSSSTWMGWWFVWLVAMLCVFWLPFDFDLDRFSNRAYIEAFTRAPLTNYYFESEFIALNEVLRKMAFFIPGGLLLGMAGLARYVPRVHQRKPRGSSISWGAMLVMVLLAWLVESGQLLLPARIADLTDFLLESIGGLLGYGMARWIGKPLQQPVRTATATPPDLPPSVAAPLAPAMAASAPVEPRPPAPPAPPLSQDPPTQGTGQGIHRGAYAVLGLCVAAAVAYIWVMGSARAIEPAWLLYWTVCTASLLAAPRHPLVGIVAYMAVGYGISSNGTLYDLSLALHVRDGMALLALLAWALGTRSRPTQIPIWHPLVLLAGLLFGWIALSLAVAVASGSPWGPVLRQDPIVYGQCAALFWLTADVLRRERDSLLLALALVATVLGRVILQGMDGIYLESYVASLLVMVVPVGGLLVRLPRQRGLQVVAALVVLLLCGLLLATQNRNSAVAAGLVAVVYLLQWGKTWPRQLAMLAVLAACVAGLLASSYGERFRAVWDDSLTSSTANLDRSTASERIVLWHAARTMSDDSPVLGVGPGNYAQFLGLYAPGKGHQGAHNSYLQMLAETGYPGLLLYLVFFLSPFFMLQRIRRRAAATWQAEAAGLLQLCLVAYLALGLFNNRNDLVLAYAIVGWSLALGASLPRKPSRSTRRSRQPSTKI